MKKKCEHLSADGWHVPTPEARELVRATDAGGYSWRAQLRAELAGEVSRWMWPGLLLLLLAGVLLKDWLLIAAGSAALCFFAYQAFALVRTLRAGQMVTATCRQLVRPDDYDASDEADDDPWCARVRIDDTWRAVPVSCDRCTEALQEGKALELMVLVDPEDVENHWLVAFRRPLENAPTEE